MAIDGKRSRKDPRLLRNQRRRHGGEPPLDAPPGGNVARPVRIDPHALRGKSTPCGPRRIERANAPPAARDPRAPERTRNAGESVEASPIVVNEAPAFLVLVIPDMEGGRLSVHDREVLGAARGLCDPGGGATAVVEFRTSRDDLGAAGADRVVHVAGAFDGFAAESKLAAVLSIARELDPRFILFPDSVGGGADLGRRTAVALGEDAATAVWKLDRGRAVCRAGTTRRDIVRPFTRVMLLLDGVAQPVSGRTYEARAVVAPRFDVRTTIRDEGLLPFDASEIPLEEAEFIVSAGAGLSDWTAFHELVRILGATPGGSRVAVDGGFLPRHRQIGSSGRIATARVCLALGISGAAEHLQGIANCDLVIAVNTDSNSAMMKRADLAVPADAQAIMSRITERLQRREKTG